MKKIKTNRQVLLDLIKNADDMTLAILRERILTATDIQDENELRESMKSSFMSPDLFINECKKIFKAVDF
jgi:hypothetical protein